MCDGEVERRATPLTPLTQLSRAAIAPATMVC